jgi:mannan endo-1,4-beta-mannosidase
VKPTLHGKPLLGFYLPEIRISSGCFKPLENQIARPFEIVSVFWSWGLGTLSSPFDEIAAILREGKRPLVTWEPWSLPEDFNSPAKSVQDRDYRLENIYRGNFDPYIRFWAKNLRAIQGKVFLRPMHEMNGNWYPWCGTTNQNRPAEYIRAWRYIVEVFADEKVDNVEWVWCPYAVSVPEISENAPSAYFPGDDYVDWLAIDGYNWGDTRDGSNWTSLGDLFRPAYQTLADLSEKPLMIAEVGCAESGGDKAKWMEEAFQTLREDFTRVEVVVWFNTRKECDWRIDSSPDSLVAFKKALE